ncbi:MAG: SURF1 family protein [Cryobacterium sp.]|nr:SURF1 family protein [Cryobacterium sp.]MBX3309536.1 SURF1 family protein [Cryobacterium sp.]
MSGWRFVRSWRWTGYLAFVILFAIACVLLSQWQLARRAEAVAANTKVENNYDRAPVDIHAILPDLAAFSPEDEWRQIRVTGSYLRDEQLLVRTRPLAGSPGFEVLVPLRLADGDVFIVDRGWVPVGTNQDAPDAVPAAPPGTVTVVARVKPGEPHLPGRSAPPGQIATIELDEIRSRLGAPTYTGAYGLMVSEDPPAAATPTALPKPALDEGPHLSYAFQWLVFAILGFVALAWAVRQEYRNLNADDPAERQRAEARRARKLARLTDAQIEDELVDRAEQASGRQGP